MRQLTLIRHGVTDWNVSGKFQGHSNVPLSEEGSRQAEALARYVHAQGEPVDHVYSSPLARALSTARIVFPDHEIVEDARLRELHFGVFEGHTQLENERHESWASWQADPFERPAPGGETYRELMARAAAWLDALPKSGNSYAFSHAGTIRMLVSYALGLTRPRWRKRIYLGHTSMTRLLFQGDEVIVERVNDTRHLAPNGLDPFED